MDAKRSNVSERLLAWYDAHRRDLPWRSAPGAPADPYRVWLSEVMLQQTTVAAVRPRFVAWTDRWPDVESLAGAAEADVMAAWAGLGYYARARNLVKAARAVVALGGFPRTEAELRRLPGLGDYTAAAVAAIAFGERAIVVDANVERVVARLFAVHTPLPGARRAIRAAAEVITPGARPGDFAQAMMDLGATICTPRAPRCLLCPLRDLCDGLAEGRPERLPVKAAKKARPQRHGTIFWLERAAATVRAEPVEAQAQGAASVAGPLRRSSGQASTSSGRTAEGEVWLVRRPSKGLLGGMRALPTGPWMADAPGLADAPSDAAWTVLDATARHGFTHFDIELALAVATGEPIGSGQDGGEWWPVDALDAAGLPTLFAKAASAVLSERYPP